MKKLLLFTLLGALASSPLYAETLDQRAANSRAAIKGFMGALKGQLKGALKSGGPVVAIQVCNTEAKAIAQAHSQTSGWEIGRTSLKLRNPDNAPDTWEMAALEKFEARKAAGEDPKKIEFYEVVNQGGKQVFRYMKAIPTAEKPCLACHGPKIKPEVAKTLDKLYPQDKARGFKPGDIRGAFTITQPM